MANCEGVPRGERGRWWAERYGAAERRIELNRIQWNGLELPRQDDPGSHGQTLTQTLGVAQDWLPIHPLGSSYSENFARQ